MRYYEILTKYFIKRLIINVFIFLLFDFSSFVWMLFSLKWGIRLPTPFVPWQTGKPDAYYKRQNSYAGYLSEYP